MSQKKRGGGPEKGLPVLASLIEDGSLAPNTHYRQLTTACNPSSSSGLLGQVHTDIENKNQGKSDTISDNQRQYLAHLELQSAEKTENTSHC